jgi:hypothetical protein
MSLKRSTAEDTGVSPRISLSSVALHARIQARAYEIYVERGAQHGSDMDDWLQAELEVAATLVSSPEVDSGSERRSMSVFAQRSAGLISAV